MTMQKVKLKKLFKNCVWYLPFCAYSADANAWGLITHLYYAQSLLWAMPLLDPRLQNAIKQFPELVMAGACLPDLAIVSKHYSKTHCWDYAHQLMRSAKNDEETAVAIGFASHLYVDVIAHNHFVPAHEASWFKSKWFKKIRLSKWFNHSAITHIASEWAMDAHLAPLIKTSPHKLLNQHHLLIAAFISPHFQCSESDSIQALKRLSFWDGVLRIVKLPHVIYRLAGMFDPQLFKHFVYYIAKTQSAIGEIGLTLNGNNPMYEPELKNLNVQQLTIWREECLVHLQLLHPLPIQYFSDTIATEP